MTRFALRLATSALAIAIVFLAWRQQQAWTFEDDAKFADPFNALQMDFRAYELNPLNRGARAALPVALDNLLQQQGYAPNRDLFDRLSKLADDGGARYNASALMARMQYLLNANQGNDPQFAGLLNDLGRDSNRVAGYHAIKARYELMHGDIDAALEDVRMGMEHPGSTINGTHDLPGPDQAIQGNLQALAVAAARMKAGH